MKVHIKKIKLAMDDLVFNEKGPILGSNFLACFAAEKDILEMSETQAYVGLPNFLSGFGLEQYRAVFVSLTVDEGGVTNFPQAV